MLQKPFQDGHILSLEPILVKINYWFNHVKGKVFAVGDSGLHAIVNRFFTFSQINLLFNTKWAKIRGFIDISEFKQCFFFVNNLLKPNINRNSQSLF